jgi:site-specific DNA-adenine methylase
VTITNLWKFPAPYFGGKTGAAPFIWAALGDVGHYLEGFSGSSAVLLLRPHPANRTYHSETANDADGLLVNALRSIQLSPRAAADAASWYVSEADLHARHLAILRWRAERDLERLMGDPAYHDPVIGGYWLWGLSCWIGSGWCSGEGPWIVGHDGRITKRPKGRAGVSRKLPHVSDNGRGVNRPQLREEGVSRQLPHVSDNGRGVNHAGAREEGVSVESEPGELDDGRVFHSMTMPELLRWFEFLAARLRHVRILNGDWKRCVTSGVLKTITVRQGTGKAGIFLDPPYRATDTRDANLYTHDDGDKVSAEVREWCKENGDDPDYRIVLAGFAGEGHEELEALGWRCESWFQSGFLKGGMAQQGEEGHSQDKERLWISPHCLTGEKGTPKQTSLF